MIYQQLPRIRGEDKHEPLLVSASGADATITSGDPFPTVPAESIGYTVIESDTGDKYEWTGAIWIKIGTAGGSEISVKNFPAIQAISSTNSLDFLTLVAQGKVAGHSLDAVICRNPTLQATTEDLWAGNDIGGGVSTATMVQPTGAESYEIRSTSPDDTLLGDGMRTVLVRTRDANGVTAFQFVNMNGTTPVALIGTHIYPAGLFGGTVDVTLTGKNIGNIILQVAGGGDVRNVMVAGVGRSHDCHYKVPAGKTAFVLTTQIFPEKNEKGFFMNEFRPDDGVSSWQDGSVLPFYEGAVNINFQSRPPLPAGYVLRLQATSGSATQDLSCLFELLLIDDVIV